MFTRLIESLAATEALSQVFSDGSVLQAMLDFEAALARAEARVGRDSGRCRGGDRGGGRGRRLRYARNSRVNPCAPARRRFRWSAC